MQIETIPMEKKSLWERLWDYDPNALVVVNPNLLVTLVNPAFCSMFNVRKDNVIGYPISRILDDPEEFTKVWDRDEVRKAEGKEYPNHNVFVRRVLFPIKEENVIACIMVDLTKEWMQQKEMLALKSQSIEEVTSVINKQMRIAQEIARLMGETTAESKISLHRLLKMINKDIT
jgi:PAS domain S-box-containing protein